MNKKKKIAIAIGIVLMAVGAYQIYNVYFNYRLMTITEGKVYKSGVIPPDKLDDFVEKYHIKSIIDLRGPVTTDLVNNPENQTEISAQPRQSPRSYAYQRKKSGDPGRRMRSPLV